MNLGVFEGSLVASKINMWALINNERIVIIKWITSWIDEGKERRGKGERKGISKEAGEGEREREREREREMSNNRQIGT